MPVDEQASRFRRRAFLATAGAGVPLLAGAATEASRNTASAVVDPRAFGAVGDGVRDDTAALQAALDSAAAMGGGTVAVPPGVFLTRTLILPARVHLAGAGVEATILKLPAGANVDLLQTREHARFSGSDKPVGPFNWSVRDLTLDGHRARNAAGCGLRAYGWGFTLRDLRIRQCAGAGIDSEWCRGDPPWSERGLDTPGDSMEAQVVNLKVHHCGAGGIRWRGPHDSQFVNVVVYDTTTAGIHLHSGATFSATGCQLANVHVWGGHDHGVRVEAGYVTLVNVMAEWAKSAQVLIADDDASIVAGRFFGNTKARHVGIEIGTPARPVYGTLVDARMADLTGGALKFTNEGGSGSIRALVYQTSGVATTGKPARSTRLDVQVHGIDSRPRLAGAVDWSPPEMAAGKAVWTEVVVPDATVGDTVAVSFSQPLPPGAILSGNVTSEGIVSVTLFNATATPLRPRGGIVRADCRKL